MARSISYFIFSSTGSYLRWDDDPTIGFTIRQYQMSITGGSSIDRLYAGAKTQVDATGLFASAGVDQLYFSGNAGNSGNFSDYTQTVSSSGVYTFTGLTGGTHAGEVISFSMTSSGDTLVFADRMGTVQLSTYLNIQTNTFALIQPDQLTPGVQPNPATGAEKGNAASKVFVFDSGGISIPQLPIVGEAIAITGGSGIDSFYVRKGTNADATGLFASAGIDVLYLTGKFTDYTQTVSSGGVYTFTRTFTGADAGLSEVVSFSLTSSGDKLVFADGGATLQLSHYLSGNSFAMILATDLDRNIVTPGLLSAPVIQSFTAVDAGNNNGTTLGKQGETVTFLVTMSEVVTVTTPSGGTAPSIIFNVGSGATATSMTATYTGGTGTNTLTFTATIPANANGASLSVSSISLGTSTVTGTVSTHAWATTSVGQTYAGYQIDTAAPSSIGIAGTSGNVAENSVGAVTLTANANNVAGESSTVTWSLGTGGDNSLFTVTSAGVLSFNSAPNFEKPRNANFNASTNTNAYTVNVIATDAAGNASAPTAVVVNVSDVNEAPTVTAQTPSQTAVLNQPFSVNVSTAFSDPDTLDVPPNGVTNNNWGVLTYAATGLPAGFTINSTTGVISGTATAAAGPVTVTVTATDGGTLSVTETFSLSVVAAPTIASFTAVDAGGTNGATLGKAGETVTFSVTMSEAVTVTGIPTITFNVGTGASATTMTASYTSGTGTTTLIFTATAPIPAGANGTLSVASITVPATASVVGTVSTHAWATTSVGQTYAGYQIDTTAPSGIAISGTSGNVAENSVGAVTLTANANNVTGEPATVTWALGTGGDNSLFTVTSAGVLSFNSAPNFERPRNAAFNASTNTNAYTVNVIATDAAGNASAPSAVVVNVTDVNEAPTVTAQTTAKTAVVNQPFSVNVSTAFSDPDTLDVPPNGVTNNNWGVLTYAATGLPAGFTINTTTGVISGTATAAAGPVTVTVTATDGGTLSVTETFSLSVVSAPTIASFTAVDAGNNNGTTLGKAGETVTFSVTMSEAVTVTGIPTITFNVGTGASATTMTASYTSGTGTSTLIFTATAPIPAGANGTLSVASITVPAAASVVGVVGGQPWVTSSVGQSYAGYQIDTTAPSSIAVSGTSGNVAENTVGTVTLTANANNIAGESDAVTWSLSGTGADNNLFTITSAGVLSFKPANTPDFEMPRGVARSATNTNAYTVNVIATDAAGNASAPSAVVVNVTDVNEAPVVTAQTTAQSVLVNQPITPINVAGAFSDPDNEVTSTAAAAGHWGTLTYTASGLPTGLSINSAGVISGTATTTTASPLTITVTATDGGSLSVTETFSLSVVAAPVIASFTAVDAGNNNGNMLGKAGEVVTFSVTMSEAVTVTGIPTITFNVGTGANMTAMTATYVSGSSTSILTFTGTVPTGAQGTLSVGSITIPAGGRVVGVSSSQPWMTTSVGQTYADYRIDTTAPSNIATLGTSGDVAENTVGAVTLTANANNVTGESSTVTWTLGTGGDTALFNLTNGVLSFKTTPNYEMPRGLPVSLTNTDAYTVNVIATDAAGNVSAATNVVVNVIDVNEAPTVTANTTTQTAVINQLFSVNVSTAFSDPDSVNTYTAGTPQWGTLTYTTSSTLPSGLTLNATTGVISGTATSATVSPVTVTVTATDGGNLSVTETFSLSVVAAPIIRSFTAMDAGNGNGATLGKAGEVVTFAVTMSESVTVTGVPTITFNVGTGAGATTMTASYVSGGGTSTLTFTATIPAGANGTSLSVASINIPASASVTGTLTNNTWLTSVVGQPYAGYTVDTVAAPLTLALASDTGASSSDGVTSNPTINVSGLEAGASWQYQVDGTTGTWQTGTGNSLLATNGVHSYFVRQTDVAGNISTTSTATYTLDTAAPVAPTLSLAVDTGSSSSDGITRNPTINVGALEAGTSWQYRVDTSAWQTGTGTSFTATSGAHNYFVQQIDLAGNTSTIGDAVPYTVDNSAPSAIGVAGTTGNVDENTRGSVTLTANANDAIANASVTWSLGTGADSALFSLNANGVLSFINAPSYQTPRGSAFNAANNNNAYTLNVVATDAAGNTSAPQQIVVRVIDVNQVPVAVGSLSVHYLTQNVPYTFDVHTYFSDPDILDVPGSSGGMNTNWGVLTYTATGLPTGLSINTTTGVISGTATGTTALAGAPVTITATDGGGLSVTQSFNFAVLNQPVVTGFAVVDDTATNGVSLGKQGEALTFTLTMSEAVTVDVTGGTPSVTFMMNGQSVTARYSSGSGTTSLLFTGATVPGGDGSQTTLSTINLNGGTVSSAVRGAWSTSATGQTYSGYTVDNTALAPTLQFTDTGFSALDGITANQTIKVSGLESSATWSYQIDGAGNWLAGSGSFFTATAGAHSYSVRQVDLAGNTSAVSTSVSVTLDLTPPAAPTLALASDTGASANDGITSNGTINLTGLETAAGTTWQYQVDGGTWTAGTGASFTASGGAHVYNVRQIDVAGNIGASSVANYTLLSTAMPPSLRLASDTGINHGDGLTNNPTIAVLGLGANATWQYQVDGGAWVTGTGATFTATVGAHGYAVQQVDVAGNTSTVSTSVNYTLNTTPPAVINLALASDTGTSNTDGITNNPTVNVTGLGAGTTWQYQLDGTTGVWQLGTNSSFLATAGTHSYFVQQVDAAGNVSSPTMKTFVYYPATTAPTLALASDTGLNANDGITNNPTIKVLGLFAGQTWQYQVNGGAWVNGGDGYNFIATSGQNNYVVRSQDVAGNTSAASVAVNFTLDTTIVAPSLALASDTGSSSSDGITSNPTINVLGLKPGASWQYQVDDGSWINGTGNSFTATAGAHRYEVLEIDLAGNNITSAPVNYQLYTSVNAPSLSLASDTGSSANDGITANPTINVLGLAVAAAWQYQIDGGTWINGVVGTSSFVGSAGNHVYKARQTDLAGNPSSDSVAVTYNVDTSTPNAPALLLASDTGSSATDNITNNPTIQVLGLGGTGSWQYRVDSGNWTTGTGASFIATQGSHSYSVQQTNLAGNTSSFSTSTFVLKTTATAPSLVLVSDTGNNHSDGLTNNRTIKVLGLDSNATWSYQVDGAGAWIVGTGTTLLAMDGPHSYAVRQVDVAGNTSAPSVAVSFTLNTTQLTLPVLSLASDTGISASDGVTNNPTINVSSLPAGNSWQYQVDGTSGAWLNGNGGSFTASSGLHTYFVKQTDAAGNVSSIGNAVYTLDTTVPVSPTLALASDTGSSAIDGITSNPTILVQGLEAGGSWQYKKDADNWVTVTNGNSFLASEGTHTYVVQQLDKAGNVSPASAPPQTYTLQGAPSITSTSFSPNEQSTAVGTLLAGAGQTVTWSLGTGSDTALFSVTSNGVLSFISAPSYEMPRGRPVGRLNTNTYTLNVIATNVAGAQQIQSVAVDVADINEAPVAQSIPGQLAATNRPFSLALSTYFSDPDSVNTYTAPHLQWGTLTYSISSANLPSSFSLASTGVFSGTATATLAPTTITVTATDGGNLSTTQTFTFAVLDKPAIASFSVSDANSPTNIGRQGNSETLTFTVLMNEAVDITTTGTFPTLTFSVNGVSVTANYLSGNGSNTLLFSAAVPSGNGNNITLSTINLQGATIAGQSTHSNLDPAAAGATGQTYAGYTVDNTPPAVPTLSLAFDTGANTSDGITSNATINIQNLESTATWQYKVDSGSWMPGSGSSFTATSGAHSYVVQQTDAAGNTSALSTVTTYTLLPSAVAPTLQLASDTGSSALDGVTSNATIVVSGLSAGASWSYQVDGGSWMTGTGGSFTATSGAHSYVVRQTDLAGNVSQPSASQSYTLLTTTATPSLSLASDTGISATDNITSNATIRVGGLVATGTTWQYKVDTGDWQNGTGNSFIGTSGTHSYVVQQIDLAGNSVTSTVATYTIYPNLPIPALALASDTGSGANDGITSNPTINVTGLVTGTGVSWQYQIDGRAWITGTGASFTALDGKHSYLVRQIDVAGNTSVLATAVSYTLDTVAATPAIALASDTGSSANDGITNNPTINVLALEAGASWQYQVDGSGGWLSSDNSTSFTATAGLHTYLVRQIDVAGNTSATSVAAIYTLDQTAPTINGANTFTTVENATGVVTLSATPSDVAPVGTVTWSLGTGADSALFTLTSNGVLSFTAAPNFEMPRSLELSATNTNVYTVNVIASDVAGNTTTRAITYTVTDINEAPVAALIPNQLAVVRQAFSLSLGQFFKDPDNQALSSTAATGNWGTLTYTSSALPSGFTLANGSISGTATSALSGALITVTATDGGGLSSTQTFTLGAVAQPEIASFAVVDSGLSGPGQTNSNGPNLGRAGEGLTFNITMSEPVTVAGGVPRITFSVNGNPVIATYSSGSGTNVLIFAGGARVPLGDGNNVSISAIDLSGATITGTQTTLTFTSTGISNAIAGQTYSGYTVDNTPPVVPTLSLAVDSGSNTSDGVTNNATILVSGLERTASWQYKIDGAGAWMTGTGSSFVGSAGKHSYFVQQTDLAGNTSGSSAAVIFVVDTTVASPTLVLASDTGLSSNDNLTNNPTINVMGLESSASWQYQVDGANTWTVGIGSSFTASVGAHTYKVLQVDLAGNTSATNTFTVYTLDTTPPSVPVLSLASDTGVSASDNVTANPTVLVSGLDPSTTWQYQIDGAGAWISGDGVSFNATGGVHTYVVQQLDAAGNISSSAPVAYTLNTAPPAAPILSLARDGGTNTSDGITGNPTVNVGGLVLGATWSYQVDGSGSWINGTGTTFTATSGTHNYAVQQTDLTGNVSESANASYQIITTLPSVSSVLISGVDSNNLPKAGALGSGDKVVVTVSLSEAVTVTATPYMATYTVNIGGVIRTAVYDPVSSTPQTLVFSYTVVAGDGGVNGLVMGADNGLWMDGSITSALSGNTLLSTVPTSTATVAAVAITNVSGTSNNYAIVGSVVTAVVVMSAPVTVTGGEPQLSLNIGGTIVQASYSGLDATRTNLLFTYVVLSGQADINGISIPANAISLNGGTIRDATTAVNAILTQAGVQDNPNYLLDAITPPKMSLSLLSDTGTSASDGITSNPTINVTGLQTGTTWQYQVDNGQFQTGTGNSFTATPGTHSYKVVQTDAAGNISPTSTSVSYTLQLPPTVSSVQVAGTHNGASATSLVAGDVIKVTATLSESVTVTGAPSYTINLGGVSKTAIYSATPSPSTAIAVSSVQVAGTHNGASATSLVAGDIIKVTATLGEAVTVTGTPSYTINIGGVSKTAIYSAALSQPSSTTTPTLVFTYTVVAGDSLASGGISAATDALSLVGATVSDTAGKPRNATNLGSSILLPTNTLSVTTSGTDATSPNVVSVGLVSATGIQNNTLTTGSIVTVKVVMSEAVTVSGTPQLALLIGGTTVQANYAAGSGSNQLSFVYTILSGQADANGISIAANSLSLNGGSMRDAAGNNASLTLVAVSDNPNYTVANPTLVFTYTVVAGDTLASGGVSALTNALSLVGATVSDTAGNTLNLANLGSSILLPLNTLSVTTTGSDATAPSVVSVALFSATGIQNNILTTGSIVTVKVLMSETVTVSGTPQLALLIGSATVQANYAAGSGSNQLTFTYTILSGQADANGISIAANALSLNGGSIKDAANNNASLTFAAVSDNSNYIVNTSQPTPVVPPSAPSWVLASDTGSSASDGLTNNPTVNVTGLLAGNTWQYQIDGNWINGVGATFLASAGLHTYNVRQIDPAGNTSLPRVAVTYNLDTIAPVVTGVATSGVSSSNVDKSPALLVAGDKVKIVLTFSDPINVVGTPTYSISLGGTSRLAQFDSTPDSTHAVFYYTLLAGETGDTSISVPDNGLNVTSTNGVFDTAGNLAINQQDTVGPSVLGVSITSASSTFGNGVLVVGSVVTATVTMSEATFVTNNIASYVPELVLNIGNSTVFANYQSGSGTNRLVFVYTLDSTTPNDTNGISISANAIVLNNELLLDAAGNRAQLSNLAVADSGSYVVKTSVTAPTLTLTPDTGISSTDGITNSTLAAVNVGAIESGATWSYRVDGAATWINGTGNSFRALGGLHSYTVRQTDFAGNTAQTVAQYNIDLVAPAAPNLNSTTSIVYNNFGIPKAIFPSAVLPTDTDIAVLKLNVAGADTTSHDVIVLGTALSKVINSVAASGTTSVPWTVFVNGVAVGNTTQLAWTYSSDGTFTFTKANGGAFTASEILAIEQRIIFQTSAAADSGTRAFALSYTDLAGNVSSTAVQNVLVSPILVALDLDGLSSGNGYLQGMQRALSLNGTTSYAALPSNLSVGGDLTLELWANPNLSAISGGGILLELTTNAGAYIRFGITTATNARGAGYLYLETSQTNVSNVTGTLLLTADEWSHLAVTVDASNNVMLYVNGNPAGSGALSETLANLVSNTALLGKGAAGGYFAGQVRDVRIYDSARTATNIATDIAGNIDTTDTNLRAAYSFQNGASSSVSGQAVATLNGSAAVVLKNYSLDDSLSPAVVTLTSGTVANVKVAVLAGNILDGNSEKLRVAETDIAANGSVTSGTVVVGGDTWAWGYSSASTTFTFTLANASATQAQRLIQSLGYRDTANSFTAGDRDFFITVTDSNGNVSAPANARIDLLPPLAPTLSLATGITAGAIVSAAQATQAGGIVNIITAGLDSASATVTFTGSVGSVQKTIPVVPNATQTITLSAIDLRGIGDGAVSVSATITDLAGNQGAATTSNFVLDTTPPTGAPSVAFALSTLTGFVDEAVTLLGVGNASSILLSGGSSSSGTGITGGLSPVWVKSTAMPNAWISSNYEGGQTIINVIWLRDSTTTLGAVEYYRIAASQTGNVSSATLQTQNFGSFGTAVLPANWTLGNASTYQYSNVLVNLLQSSVLLTDDTGSSASDGISSNGRIVLAITPPVATDTWQYSTNGGATWTTGVAPINGLSSLVLPNGTYIAGSIQVRYQDAAGNGGAIISNSAPIVIDTTPPIAPTLTLAAGVNAAAVGISQAQAVSGIVMVSAEVGTTVSVTFSRPSGVNTVVKTLVATGTSQTVALTASEVAGLGSSNIMVAARATDVAGNIGPTNTLSLTFDLVQPTVSVTLASDTGASASDGVTNNPTINVGSLVNGGSWQYHVDGGAWMPGVNSSIVAQNGLHTYFVQQTSASGNVGIISSLQVNLDTTPPSAPTISQPPGTATILVSGLEATATWQYQVDGTADGSWITGTGNSFNGLNGSHTYNVRQIDLAGNVSPIAPNNTYTISVVVPPVIALASDTGISAIDGLTNNPTVIVSGVAADGGWEYQVDSAPFLTGTGNFFLAQAGSHQYSVRQVSADRTQRSASTSAVYDFENVAPVVSSVSLSSTSISNTHATLMTGDVVTVTVLFSEAVTVTGTPTISINIGGTQKSASYASGSGTNSLLMVYTLESDLLDSNGISVDAGSLTLPSGARIIDAAGNVAVPSYSALVDVATLPVDSVLPSFTLSSSTPNASSTLLTFTFNKAVTGFTASDITLSTNALRTDASAGSPAQQLISFTQGAFTAVDATHYTLSVSGFSGTGTLSASVAANAFTDANGTANLALNASTSYDRKISLGAGNGQLIKGVQVEGVWYYAWDVNGDGVLNVSDQVGYSTIQTLFGATLPSGTVTINGASISLPGIGTTLGSAGSYPGLADSGGTGWRVAPTAISGQGTGLNPTFDGLLSIWDAFNGKTTTLGAYANSTNSTQGLAGTPPGWNNDVNFWSSTTPPTLNSPPANYASTGKLQLDFSTGIVNDDPLTASAYVAFSVVLNP